MRPVIPWRSRSAFLLFIPAVAFVALYGLSYVDLTPITGYWTAVGAGSAVFLFISCALAAVSGAIEGSRARRGNLRQIGVSRPYVQVLFVQLWPSVLLAGVVQGIAFLMLAQGTWGAPGTVPVLVPIAFGAIIFFHTAIGYALGRILPLAAGIPVALVLSYSWLGFTWSVNFFPLRYLAGLALSGCCRVDSQLDERALAAAIVFNLGAGMAVLVTTAMTVPRVARPRTLMRPVVGTALLVASAIIGVAVAQPLGPYPTTPRDAAELRCQDGDPTVCLYPEQSYRSDPTATLRQASANLESIGVKVPDRIVASAAASTTDTLNVALRPDMTPSAIIYSFSTAFLQPQLFTNCPGAGSDGIKTRSLTAATIIDWLLARSSEGILDTPPPSRYVDGAAPAKQLLTLTDSEQVEWYKHNLAALTDCSLSPTSPPKS
ncbi:hypothetical protein SAMN06295879_0792 [Agreia bicolorata]|uniref:DUF7224 domain-containing protein n=1 Tax=Agreia bicolorata TaxID=110935 RepID=A0A1T4X7T4_9MICO|nr:hypothetical protein [Agreia bicolorata]SKA85616.1 hypothetical protein SAMN06295879_0792 [Agreia bicolorata]